MVIFEGESVVLSDMKITVDQLEAQCRAAMAAWPEIAREEAAEALPFGLLFAVGSRETNLSAWYVDHPGDQGHGHGLFQLDDRWHSIPDAFSVEMQAGIAAQMLGRLHGAGHTWRESLNMYNSGSPLDEDTTGGDYGRDVLARAAWLNARIEPPFDVKEDWEMADSPVAQEILQRLDRLEVLLDQRSLHGRGMLMWRVGQVLNMLQRQIELGAFKRPPDYVEWHNREQAWLDTKKGQLEHD